MKTWPALLLLTVSLAGCGDSPHALDAYIMRPSDVPGACYLIDPDDDPWAQAAAFVDWQKNPGPVSKNMLRLGGVTPSDTRVAGYECKFEDGYHQYVSGAMTFETASDARTWVQAAQSQQQAFMSARCSPEAMVFLGETVVGVIATFEDWHPSFESAAKQRFGAIVDRPGVEDYCA